MKKKFKWIFSICSALFLSCVLQLSLLVSPNKAHADSLINVADFSQDCSKHSVSVLFDGFDPKINYSLTVFIGDDYYHNYIIANRDNFSIKIQLYEEKLYSFYLGDDAGGDGYYSHYTDICKSSKKPTPSPQPPKSTSQSAPVKNQHEQQNTQQGKELNRKISNKALPPLPTRPLLPKIRPGSPENQSKCRELKMIFIKEDLDDKRTIIHISALDADGNNNLCITPHKLTIAIYHLDGRNHIIESLYEVPIQLSFAQKNVSIPITDRCNREMRLYLDRSQDLASFVDRDENEASLVKYRWPDQQAVYSYNEDCTLDKEDKVTWSKAANSGTALIIIVSLAFLFDILSRSIKSKD